MSTRPTQNRSIKKAAAARNSGFGQAVLASLRGWERGEPLTVRHVSYIPAPRALPRHEIRRLRTKRLGVSQAVFAQLLGVSTKLVEAWEAGRNVPAGPVWRLIELIELNPDDFLKRYVKGAA
jgi:putative transcriptional regulator